ncbi:hypothetical protein HMPREF0880_01806 [Yokenella regensburgei ATCC 43003]|nr:hypothetical protein HMPREF0880_01806 [Yokenella regensburgei ATCC 43003]
MDKAENFVKNPAWHFLLRKRKELRWDLRQYVNTNENHYQFDVSLI